MIFKVCPCDIGIITHFLSEKDRPMGRQTLFIEACLNAAGKYHIEAAVFDPVDLWKSRGENSEGYSHDGGKWIRKKFNFPRVIYDRYYSKITGFDPEIEKIKDNLNRNCYFINPPEFARMATDKILFFKKMCEYRVKTPRIICERLECVNDLRESFKGHDQVIIKPAYGRMGKGIIRVKRQAGRFEVIMDDFSLTCKTEAEMTGAIRYSAGTLGMSTNDFIIQEMVRIVDEGRQWFDIRVLMQRGGEGNPEITGMVARVSAGKKGVPNLDRGGIAVDGEQWLQWAVKTVEWDGVKRQIWESAGSLYRLLEKEYGLIGEIGMDLLVDEQNNVWILEINSKPGRWALLRLATGFGMSESQRQKYSMLRESSIEKVILYGKKLFERT